MTREDQILSDWQKMTSENVLHVCGQAVIGIRHNNVEMSVEDYMNAWRQRPGYTNPDKKLRVVLENGELGPFVFPRWHNSIEGKQILMLRTAFGVVLVCDNQWTPKNA